MKKCQCYKRLIIYHVRLKRSLPSIIVPRIDSPIPNVIIIGSLKSVTVRMINKIFIVPKAFILKIVFPDTKIDYYSVRTCSKWKSRRVTIIFKHFEHEGI